MFWQQEQQKVQKADMMVCITKDQGCYILSNIDPSLIFNLKPALKSSQCQLFFYQIYCCYCVWHLYQADYSNTYCKTIIMHIHFIFKSMKTGGYGLIVFTLTVSINANDK